MRQRYGLVVVTAPADEPVAIGDARAFCRIDASDEDGLLAGLVKDARERCERVTGRALITQSLRLTLDHWPGHHFAGLRGLPPGFGWAEGQPWGWGDGSRGHAIELPRPPLSSVTSLQYVDMTGVLQTLDPSLYQVDADGEPGRIVPAYGKCWPAARHQLNAITVVYQAGYGADPATIPCELTQRLLNFVAYCYENRVNRDERFLDTLFEGSFCGTY